MSILIPAYNCQEWVANAIESALAQTWRRKEIILVDDGSTDETLRIAKRFSAGNVLVLGQENRGAAAARNKAFSLSQGEYIQWLDADDLLAPGKIARQMEAAGSYPDPRVLFSCAWGRFINRPHKAVFSPTALWCDLGPVEWMLRKLEQNVFMQTAVWLTSRELAEAAGPWDTRMMGDDDGEYFSRVQLQSRRIQFVPEARVYYRLPAPKSLSYLGQSERKLAAHALSLALHIRYLRAADTSERSRRACLTYLQTNFAYFHPDHPALVREVQEIAGSLGGTLVPPRLSWKVRWIKALFGWPAARWAHFRYDRTRRNWLHVSDRLLERLECLASALRPRTASARDSRAVAGGLAWQNEPHITSGTRLPDGQ